VPDILIEPAGVQDLPRIGAVFARAFPQSIAFFLGDVDPASPRLQQGLADFVGLAYRAEPGAFLVAREAGRETVVGYTIATRDFPRLWQRAFLRGWWLTLVIRWIRGCYGLSLRTVSRVLRNKFFFLSHSRKGSKEKAGEAGKARILSLAVDPDYQGGGIGGRLLEEGFRVLKAAGQSRVSLEVRLDNERAYRLYTAKGFQKRGTFRDLQGDWLVLEKNLEEIYFSST
jgi:[ribosomal protein S18]-alanine N-acetyltransferase